MTLQQEAYNKIDQLSDDNVRFVIQLIDKIQQGGTNEEATSSRQKKKNAIMKYAGKIDVDEDAVNELRERSMI
ncbi:MAG: hypothetical protein SPL99_02890 [Catonella sp.]|nr:hypothetical protein [Catonella sp.]MDY6356523.1 hypothetical protein [Catonella sp.]